MATQKRAAEEKPARSSGGGKLNWLLAAADIALLIWILRSWLSS